jgi:hypothetical protein
VAFLARSPTPHPVRTTRSDEEMATVRIFMAKPYSGFLRFHLISPA